MYKESIPDPRKLSVVCKLETGIHLNSARYNIADILRSKVYSIKREQKKRNDNMRIGTDNVVAAAGFQILQLHQ